MTLNGEAAALLAMTLCGAAISVFFDFLRSLRRVIRFGTAAAAVSDVIFWMSACTALAACLWLFNDGELRFYEFAGMIIGSALYFCTLSGVVMKLFTLLITKILKIIRLIFKILLTPLKFLYKILIVPVLKLINMIRNKVREKGRKYDGRKNKNVSPKSDRVYSGASKSDKDMAVRSDNGVAAVQRIDPAAADIGKPKANTKPHGEDRLRKTETARG